MVEVESQIFYIVILVKVAIITLLIVEIQSTKKTEFWMFLTHLHTH